MSRITRRLLLASTAAIAIASQAAKAGIFPRGGVGVTSGGATTSITFANLSASATPSGLPIQTTQMFARGAVPSGFIATPTVGGVSLATWQADNRTTWDDGSVMTAVYRFLLPSGIAGSSAQQVTFPITAGSWPNTSSNTITDVTSGSNFNLALSNLHTAQVGVLGILIGLTMSGGAITGGTIWQNWSGNNGTYSVAGGHGTGGSVTITGTTLTIAAGGSGYAPEGTNGQFKASFNTGVTNANYVKQYAKGPCCDAWEVAMQFIDSTSSAVLPHLWAVFYVERWKTATGTLLGFKATARINNGTTETATQTGYTYDVDWKNGSTVIRGATNSTVGWNTIQHCVLSAMTTLDRGDSGSVQNTARCDWDNGNGAAYNQVIQQRTPTECDQAKLTGVVLPLTPLTTSVVAPTTRAAFGTGDSDLAAIPYVQPMGNSGLRVPFGSGGAGDNENIHTLVNILHWLTLRDSNTTDAATWLVCSRAAAANFSAGPFAGSVVETATFYQPNVIPPGRQSFSGMTPDRSTWDLQSLTPGTAFVNPVLSTGTVYTGSNPYHAACYSAYPYLVEGEQWMLGSLKYEANNENLWYTYTRRQMQLGSGTTYYSINLDPDTRVPAWSLRALGEASRFMPPTWADGSTNIEQAYQQFCLGQNYSCMLATMSFTGTVTAPASSWSKTNDWTTSGVFNWRIDCEVDQMFMDDYLMSVTARLAFLFQGTLPDIASWRDIYKLFYVGQYAYVGSHYLSDCYSRNLCVGPSSGNLNGQAGANPPTNWATRITPNTPSAASSTDDGRGVGTVPTLDFTNGQANIDVGPVHGTSIIMCFNNGTAAADGTAVYLTTTNINGETPNNTVMPTPFVGTQFYYIKNVVGQSNHQVNLYSDSGLTTLVTPTQTVSGVNFYFVPANALPADTLGKSLGDGYVSPNPAGNSRIGTTQGMLKMCKAYGMNDTGVSLTDALTHIGQIWGGRGGSYAGMPLYNYDTTL